MTLVIAALAACAPSTAPAPTPEPWPDGLEIVWDLRDSTDTGGRGPYFTQPDAPRLRQGAVYVAWSCSGRGILSVVPAVVEREGAEPPRTSPLAFQLVCPTSADAGVLRWKELSAEAQGGENVAQIRPAVEPMAPIQYRIVFAQ